MIRVLISAVAFLLLVFLFLLINPFTRSGYGGSPSGFKIEGDTLYVADYGNFAKPEGPALFWPKSKPAIWVVSLEEKEITEFRKLKDRNDNSLKEISNSNTKIDSSPKSEITINDKIYTLTSSGLPPYANVPNELQIKDLQGNTISTTAATKGTFNQIVTDPKNNIYILGFSTGQNPNQYLYIFDANINQITNTIELPLRGIQTIEFTESKIYIVGTQSRQEEKFLPEILLVYDRNKEKLEELVKIKNYGVSGTITNGKFIYGEKGDYKGFKKPSVTIYDLEENKEEAKIIGEGMGPNPYLSVVKIVLHWIAFPFFVVFGVFTYIFSLVKSLSG